MSDFKREVRYYVIKVKDLTETQDIWLCNLISGLGIPCRDSVVVEKGWRNYEHTWKTVERVSDGSYSDPYAEIERWKKVAHDQAETISELGCLVLVHQQRQGADICRCIGPGNGCCCDICEPSPPSDRLAENWKLVPIVPTKSMQDAWDTAPTNECADQEFIDAYQAMLDAAPQPPKQEGE